jgi:hypothetical protein
MGKRASIVLSNKRFKEFSSERTISSRYSNFLADQILSILPAEPCHLSFEKRILFCFLDQVLNGKPRYECFYGTIFPNKGIFCKIITIISEETINKKVTKGTEIIGLSTFVDNKCIPNIPLCT